MPKNRMNRKLGKYYSPAYISDYCFNCRTKDRKIKQLEEDKERLDFLDSLNGSYTGKVQLRMSTRGRGFRLHETSMNKSFKTVREAIDKYKKSLED